MAELVKDGTPYTLVYRTENHREANVVMRTLAEHRIPIVLAVDYNPSARISELYARVEDGERAETLIAEVGRRALEDSAF